jgi:hypothetical protein
MRLSGGRGELAKHSRLHFPQLQVDEVNTSPLRSRNVQGLTARGLFKDVASLSLLMTAVSGRLSTLPKVRPGSRVCRRIADDCSVESGRESPLLHLLTDG